MSTFAVILPAAGRSSRFQDAHYKKPFAMLNEKPVWLHAADRFLSRRDVKQVIVVVSPEDRETFDAKFGPNIAIMGVDVAEGGKERADSVGNALAMVRDGIEYIAVHDAARPCIADKWISAVFEKAQQSGAAILANPVAATLKRVDGEAIEETVSRERLWEAQTPQVFRRDILEAAYANRGEFQPTDEAQLVEKHGATVSVVKSSLMNLKITTKDDLRLAAAVLKVLPKPGLDLFQ